MKKRKISTKPVILTGSYNPEFAHSVGDYLNMEVSEVEITRFANTEIKTRHLESVRDSDVFIIQSHGAPVNDMLMEHLALVNAAHHGSAREITAVMPYRAYGRADRIALPHESFMGKAVIDFFSTAGANRIVEVDPHSGQSMGFFDGLYDAVPAAPAIRGYMAQRMEDINEDVVIVSPDAGRAKLNRHYAEYFDLSRAVVDKVRTGKNKAEVASVIGDVAGKACFMIDDMIDTGGTIVGAAAALRDLGATEVNVLATHGIFSGNAPERFEAAIKNGTIKSLAVTDTLKLPEGFDPKLVDTISIAHLVGEALRKIYNGESVSGYFNGEGHH